MKVKFFTDLHKSGKQLTKQVSLSGGIQFIFLLHAAKVNSSCSNRRYSGALRQVMTTFFPVLCCNPVFFFDAKWHMQWQQN